MLIMSCYTGFFNVRRRWQSLNTGPRFYLRLIRRTGWLWISTSRTTDGRPFKLKKLSVPFLYPGVPAGLTSFRGLVPLGRRNLVPILHTLISLVQDKNTSLKLPVDVFPLQLIFLEDKHKILLHLSIFYEYQQFFQHRIRFSIQPPDYSDPWPRLARFTSFFPNNVV